MRAGEPLLVVPWQLPCISPISPVHLPCISPISPSHLPTSPPHLPRISQVPWQLCLVDDAHEGDAPLASPYEVVPNPNH